MSVTANARFVAEGLLEACSKDDACVLDGVVEVDLYVAVYFNLKIDELVT